MAINDKMTREVSALAAQGASSVSFKNPQRALIPGEWITFSGHATEYRVTSSTSTSVSFTPVLTSSVADNETITRFDKYAVLSVDDWLDEFGIEVTSEDEGKKAFAYKKLLSARSRIETRLGGPIVSRSFTETYSVGEHSSAINRMILYPNNAPIVSITSVTVNDTVLDTDDYEITRDNYAVYYEAGFPVGINHITLVYTAGYTYPEFEFRELFANVTNFLIALSPGQGKDLLLVGSNNEATGPLVGQAIRTLEDIDNYIDMHVGKYARVNV